MTHNLDAGCMCDRASEMCIVATTGHIDDIVIHLEDGLNERGHGEKKRFQRRRGGAYSPRGLTRARDLYYRSDG